MDIYVPTQSFWMRSTGGIQKGSAPSGYAAGVIHAINDTLVASSWTSVGLYGSGRIPMTFFFGNEAIFKPPPAPIIFVGNGVGVKTSGPYVAPTNFGRLEEVCGQLNQNPYYTFTAHIFTTFDGDVEASHAPGATGFLTIIVQSTIPGPDTNNPSVEIEIGVAGGFNGTPSPGACYGGGYHLTSAMANEVFLGSLKIIGLYQYSGYAYTILSGLPGGLLPGMTVEISGFLHPGNNVTGIVLTTGVVPTIGNVPGFNYFTITSNLTINPVPETTATGNGVVLAGTTLDLFCVGDVLGQVSMGLTAVGTPQPSVTYTLFADTGPVPAGVVPAGEYTIISDAFQFAIVDNSSVDTAGNFGYGGNSILACAPYVDLNLQPGLYLCAFILGPGFLKNSMTWNAGGSSSYAINNDFITFQGLFTSYNGLCTFIFPTNDPILTANKKPLLQNPYAMAAHSLLDSMGHANESAIIGQIWDAILLTQAGWQAGAEQIMNGYKCHLISQQNIPENCSLWIAFEVGTE